MKCIDLAITFHRQLHGKSVIQSALDDIPGIGDKRKKVLLKHFGSLKKMKEASIEEFVEAGMPKNVAETIYSYLADRRRCSLQRLLFFGIISEDLNKFK